MLATFLALQLLTAAPVVADPFAFFRPSVTISPDDLRQLDRGQPVARVLPGKGLEVAGDELTMTQQAELIGRVIGRPVRYVQNPPESAWNRQGFCWWNSPITTRIKEIGGDPARHSQARYGLDLVVPGL